MVIIYVVRVAVSHGYDTCFGKGLVKGLVMGYTTSYFPLIEMKEEGIQVGVN